MADDKPKSSGKVTVILTVPTQNAARGDKLEVDKKTADRLVANNQARRA